jgi:hypothetical protein
VKQLEKDFVEEGSLEILPDSVALNGKRMEEMLRKYLHIMDVGNRIRLGHVRLSIEWLEEGYREVL